MRYSLIGPTYPFRGGIAHFTTLLVHHLREHHDVRFYSYYRQYPKWFFPGNVAPDPSNSVLEESSKRIIDALNPLTWWQTARSIVSDKPDVVLLQWWTPFWLPLYMLVALLARRSHIPVLYLCHQLVEPDSSVVEWLTARPALHQGNGFIVLTEEDFVMARRMFRGKPVRAGHLPLWEISPRQNLERAEARRRLGVPLDQPLLLFFGFVRRYKGLRYLLQALAQLPTEINLLIAGDFWEEEKPYRDLMAQFGLQSRVFIHNRYILNEEIEPYFVAADALVLPYVSGAQSGVGMIALNFGLPVIATSVGGLGEMVLDGETGLIVPPADSVALADAIRRFLRDNLGESFRLKIDQMRDQLSWNALIHIIEELSVEITCAESAGATKF